MSRQSPRNTPPNSAAPLRVLIIDDDANSRTQLTLHLEPLGHHVVGHGNVYDALSEVSWQAYDLVFLDLRLAGENGSDAIARLLGESPWTKVVVMTAYSSVDAAVEATGRGACDYLPKPFTAAQVQLVTHKAAELRMLERKVRAIQSAGATADPEAEFPSASPAMARASELARTAATSNATVLIRGEIGTGKGRLARAIHAQSGRSGAPFAAVSCHNDSPDALDAELFGLSARDGGCVEHCDGGTLVIDGIGEMPLNLQVKLLRLLREREYERQDDFRPRPANVRIIATTAIDLESLVHRGKFRADLLASLETVRIDLPPLRQRSEDIVPLAQRYVNHFARENHRAINGFSPQSLQVLQEHRWPGNVRELRNVVERAVLLCQSETIGLEHLPQNLLNGPSSHAVGDLVALETIEQLHIRKVVEAMPTIASAAAVLGVHPGTVLRRLKKSPNGEPPAA